MVHREGWETLEGFVRSLGLAGPVTTEAPAAQAGARVPSAAFSLAALVLGVGRALPREALRSFARLAGVPPEVAAPVLRRIRRLERWGEVWMEEAERHALAAERHEQAGDLRAAWEAWHTVLMCQRMATFTDGVYLPVPSADVRWRTYTHLRRTCQHLARLEGRPFHELKIPGPREKVPALFHLPGEGVTRVPAVLLVHGLSGYKEFKDFQGMGLRDAGFATLSIDMPAHGERFFGERLRPDAEEDCVAALEWLAAQPEVDPDRLVLLGGSMGGYWVVRTAARSPRVRACVALATLFAFGRRAAAQPVPRARRPKVPFLTLEFARVVGSTDPETLRQIASQFTLEEAAPRVRCPLFLGHGTEDQVVPFSEAWRLARAVGSEDLTVHPYPGAGHEVSGPAPEHLPPILEWLKRVTGRATGGKGDA
jgi:alpha-beta hydrolase superfamily lysophospholipase